MDKSHQKYVAEMIGTLVLVFFGCGSAVLAGSIVGGLGIALAFGLSVLVMAYAIGGISGCHINPAVTVGMLVSGKIGSDDALKYIIFQCIGAIGGAGLLYIVASGNANYDIALNGLGQNGFGDHSPGGFSLEAALISEIFLTAVFIFVILGVTSKKETAPFAGIAIGLALALIHIVGIPLTGTSVNPARSIGPAVFVGGAAIDQLWVFITAPIVGGALGATIWKLVGEAAPKKKKK